MADENEGSDVTLTMTAPQLGYVRYLQERVAGLAKELAPYRVLGQAVKEGRIYRVDWSAGELVVTTGAGWECIRHGRANCADCSNGKAND